MSKKYKLLKPGYYNNCNFPADSVVEIEDENLARYAMGMRDIEEAKADAKVTEPTPYVMAPRKSSTEDALTTIANALASTPRPHAPAPPPSSQATHGR